MQLDLSISNLGLVSAVGEGVNASAASLRAGLARTERLPDFHVDVPFDDPSNMSEADLGAPVVAHRVGALTEGFTQTGLWLRMAVAALRDLGELPDVADAFWSRTALSVVVPPVAGPRFGWPPNEVRQILEWSFLIRLADLARYPVDIDPNRAMWAHSGSSQALLDAQSYVTNGRFDRVLIVAVDSYVDVPTVMNLVESGRIKGPDAQTGLQPGEAAAAILVERPDAAIQRKAAPCGKIQAARHAVPATPAPGFGEGEPGDRAAYFVQSGILWAKVIAEALADAGIARFAGDIIVDLNGEEWRASAWGMAQVRLQNVIDFAACKLVVPCASFGEIGAASGVAGVCLAARSFARDYATGDATLVVSLSENGEVGAIVVGRAPTG